MSAQEPDAAKFVATKPTNATVYHADPECGLATAGPREPRPASESLLAYHDLDPCPRCGGEADG